MCRMLSGVAERLQQSKTAMAYRVEGKRELGPAHTCWVALLPNLEFRNRSGRYFSIAGRNVSGLFSKYPSPLQAKGKTQKCHTQALCSQLKVTHTFSLSVTLASPQSAAGSPRSVGWAARLSHKPQH